MEEKNSEVKNAFAILCSRSSQSMIQMILFVKNMTDHRIRRPAIDYWQLIIGNPIWLLFSKKPKKRKFECAIFEIKSQTFFSLSAFI
jgi:hypothetical protein